VAAQFLIWLANSDFFSGEIGSPVSTARISSVELAGSVIDTGCRIAFSI
jgi:hypothetical protein